MSIFLDIKPHLSVTEGGRIWQLRLWQGVEHWWERPEKIDYNQWIHVCFCVLLLIIHDILQGRVPGNRIQHDDRRLQLWIGQMPGFTSGSRQLETTIGMILNKYNCFIIIMLRPSPKLPSQSWRLKPMKMRMKGTSKVWRDKWRNSRKSSKVHRYRRFVVDDEVKDKDFLGTCY